MTALITRAFSFVRPVFSVRIAATLPGIAGMALIALGASLIYLPAGLIAGGAMLLLVDSRL